MAEWPRLLASQVPQRIAGRARKTEPLNREVEIEVVDALVTFSPGPASFIRGPKSASPSNTRGGSRVPEWGPLGSGAARLATIPAGESPANRGVQSLL